MCVIRYNISNNRRFVDINQNHSIEFQKKIVFLYPEEDSPPQRTRNRVYGEKTSYCHCKCL